MTTSKNGFANEFLQNYLKNGFASMPKNEVDALVMHLVDKYTQKNGIILKDISNQSASEILRAPINKIKKLRYDAGLKYGVHVEDEGRIRFLKCLLKTNFELNTDTFIISIEDTLAKNWVQGRIKATGLIYDGSFNSEILKIKSKDFIKLVDTIPTTDFPKDTMNEFHDKFNKLIEENKNKQYAIKIQECVRDLANFFLSGIKESIVDNPMLFDIL